MISDGSRLSSHTSPKRYFQASPHDGHAVGDNARRRDFDFLEAMSPLLSVYVFILLRSTTGLPSLTRFWPHISFFYRAMGADWPIHIPLCYRAKHEWDSRHAAATIDTDWGNGARFSEMSRQHDIDTEIGH